MSPPPIKKKRCTATASSCASSAHRADGRVEGRVVQILERRAQTLVGRYDVDGSGLGFVVPFDRRVATDVHIPRGESADADIGEMVTVEITRWPTGTRGPIGRIVDVLGDIDEPGVDTEIILRKHAIPDEHSDESIDEARRIGSAVKDKDIRGQDRFPRSHRRHHRRRACA